MHRKNSDLLKIRCGDCVSDQTHASHNAIRQCWESPLVRNCGLAKITAYFRICVLSFLKLWTCGCGLALMKVRKLKLLARESGS